jgi:hypothetical protein
MYCARHRPTFAEEVIDIDKILSISTTCALLQCVLELDLSSGLQVYSTSSRVLDIDKLLCSRVASARLRLSFALVFYSTSTNVVDIHWLVECFFSSFRESLYFTCISAKSNRNSCRSIYYANNCKLRIFCIN